MRSLLLTSLLICFCHISASAEDPSMDEVIIEMEIENEVDRDMAEIVGEPYEVEIVTTYVNIIPHVPEIVATYAQDPEYGIPIFNRPLDTYRDEQVFVELYEGEEEKVREFQKIAASDYGIHFEPAREWDWEDPAFMRAGFDEEGNLVPFISIADGAPLILAYHEFAHCVDPIVMGSFAEVMQDRVTLEYSRYECELIAMMVEVAYVLGTGLMSEQDIVDVNGAGSGFWFYREVARHLKLNGEPKHDLPAIYEFVQEVRDEDSAIGRGYIHWRNTVAARTEEPYVMAICHPVDMGP